MITFFLIILLVIVLNAINSFRNYSIAEKNKSKRINNAYSDIYTD